MVFPRYELNLLVLVEFWRSCIYFGCSFFYVDVWFLERSVFIDEEIKVWGNDFFRLIIMLFVTIIKSTDVYFNMTVEILLKPFPNAFRPDILRLAVPICLRKVGYLLHIPYYILCTDVTAVDHTKWTKWVMLTRLRNCPDSVSVYTYIHF